MAQFKKNPSKMNLILSITYTVSSACEWLIVWSTRIVESEKFKFEKSNLLVQPESLFTEKKEKHQFGKFFI